MRGTQREAETQAEGEAGSHREPDAGLDSRTPGSRPEPKADAEPLCHLGASKACFIVTLCGVDCLQGLDPLNHLFLPLACFYF